MNDSASAQWTKTTLGEVVRLQRGHDLPSSRRIAGPIPVIGSGEPIGWHVEARAKGPGVVIGRATNLGRPKFISGDYWPLNTTLYVTDFLGNEPRWVYYLFQTLDLSAYNSGSVQPMLNRNYVRAVPVVLPPVAEQRAIAEVLGALDDKIEANRRQTSIAAELGVSLFRDWFEDYGPVRAKESGVDAYLASDLWSLFPFKFNELGRPAGWTEQRFGDLLLGHVGGEWGEATRTEDSDEAVCVIRGTDLADIAGGDVGKVPIRYIAHERARRGALEEGDVILEVSGGSPTQPTGRSVLVTDSILGRFPHPVVCASFCRRLRPVNFERGLLAALHIASVYAAGGTWEYQNQSTGISNFQTTRFLSEEWVVWPGEPLVHAFAELVEPLVRLASGNENVALTALRDTLVPKLLTGEIRVREAGTLVEDAV